jgi:hypothetical protein
MTEHRNPPFCAYNGSVDAHGDCCERSQQALQEAKAYADLDAEELAIVAVNQFADDVAAAADHLRRLRNWYTQP